MTITAIGPVVGIEPKKLKSIVFASCLGTVIEWYDFLIYCGAAGTGQPAALRLAVRQDRSATPVYSRRPFTIVFAFSLFWLLESKSAVLISVTA